MIMVTCGEKVMSIKNKMTDTIKMSESHAEIKDTCDGIQTKLDEIATDIREIPFNYKIVEQYTDIDQEVYEVYEWYDRYKQVMIDFENCMRERPAILERLRELDRRTRFLNHDVQNIKAGTIPTLHQNGSFSRLFLG